MSDGRKVLVLNGPNLNRLGKREPEIYGAHTLADLESMCVAWGKANGLDVQMRQTNHEGQMIDWLHEAADDGCPVVLNAAGWTLSGDVREKDGNSLEVTLWTYTDPTMERVVQVLQARREG